MKRIDYPSGAYQYVAESAGLRPGEAMHFTPGISRCGTITDGVSFNLGSGGWVIPFSELEEMYRLAKEVRAVHGVCTEPKS